jgi:hypothetical protein
MTQEIRGFGQTLFALNSSRVARGSTTPLNAAPS